ncbi:MAG TPA: cbb3-type cytochrome oxidase assembly protein CcoS [Rhodocyclaceae bacterium]
MEILYLLIPLSVVLVFLIAAFFWWSLKSGQFEDMDGPGYRILMDDDRDLRVDPDATNAAKSDKSRTTE